MRIGNYLILHLKEITYVEAHNDYGDKYTELKIILNKNLSYQDGRKYYYGRFMPTINTYLLSNLDKFFKWVLKKLNLYKYSTIEIIEKGEIVI